MHHRLRLQIALLLGSVSTALLSAQTAPSPPRRLPAATTVGTAVEVRPVTPGRLRATAPGYVAELDPAGLLFRANESGSEMRAALRYTLESAGRSGPPLPASGAAPVADGTTVRFDHGAFEESYALRDADLELSFTFHELPPGHGDLVVRGRIDTGLRPGPITANGLELTGDACGISIGAVTGIDADGVTVRGSMRFAEGVLELILPGDFVDGAALPLVLDPLIGGVVTVGGSFDQERPDVAYDGFLDLYLVVFERWISGKQHVYGQALRPDGSQVNAPFLIQAPAPSAVIGLADPRVASRNGSWICVWTDFDRLDIYCATVYLDAASNWAPAVSPPLAVADSPQPEQRPDVGGGYNVALVAWSGPNNITGSLVAANGPNAIPFVVLGRKTIRTVANASMGRVSVASVSSRERWMLAWEETSPGGGSAIVGQLLQLLTLNPKGTFDVSARTSTYDNDNPSVDGRDGDWLVAYESEATSGSGDNAIVCVRVSDPVGIVSHAVIENTPGVDEREPAVAWCGGSALVSFVEERTDTPTQNMDVFVRSIDPLSCRACEGKFGVEVSQQHTTRSPSIASDHSSTHHAERALIVWERDLYPGGTTGQIRAQRFSVEDGIVRAQFKWTGYLCAGQAFAQCARQGNSVFEHRLRYSSSPATATLLLSVDRIDESCGPCVLVPNPYTGFLLSPVSVDPATNEASLMMPIPTSTALRGLRFYEQWLIASPKTPVCSAIGLDLSYAIEVTLH